MGAYTTKSITLEEACSLLQSIVLKQLNSINNMDAKELESMLNEFVYSGEHCDKLGVLTNYRVSY